MEGGDLAQGPLQKAKKTIGKTIFCDMWGTGCENLINPEVNKGLWYAPEILHMVKIIK